MKQILFLILIIFTAKSFAQQKVGCKEVRQIIKISKLALASVDPTADNEISNFTEVYNTLCSGFIVPATGSTVYYSNGKIATNYFGQTGATWYFPNGKLITNYAGQIGATWYYSNGQLVTNYAGQKGATWYYPNGKLLTNYMGQSGATWYYSNGQLVTNYAGQKGATWYYPNGKLLTNYMGQSGATWYREDGSLWISNGPEFSEDVLLDVPRFILRILKIN